MILRDLVAVLIITAVTACSKKNETPGAGPDTGGSNTVKETGIFPKPPTGFWGTTNPMVSTGWVGDVMPFYDNGKFHIFFLHDATDGEKAKSEGQHPIHKFTSTDLVKYSYEGEMVRYGNVNSAEHLIGTGSVLKYKNEYYFYYTGHNGSPGWTALNPRENVLKATSTDLSNWTKNTGFKLTASPGYTSNDFRDPYVFFNEEFNEYWMLVSTRRNEKGVLARYSTDDPSKDNWVLREPLEVEGDYLMLECADIFKMGSQYYMFFAEDWSGSPGTRYRVSSSTAGPWRKPEIGSDMLDGHSFYAGKTASDGTNRYLFAWNHRRNPETDAGNRTWGGNLVVHQLTQNANGSLGVKSPTSVGATFSKQVELKGLASMGTVSSSSNAITVDGGSSASIRSFEKVGLSLKIRTTISVEKSTGVVGFVFNAAQIGNPTYKILFEPARSRIAAYNIIGGISNEVSRVPFSVQAGSSYSVDILIDGSTCVLYVDGKVALTNRIYSISDNPWGIIAEGNKGVFFNMSIWRPI
ncbi:glycoside hydrolase family 32 protein [Desertivirga brevis]|uniref:glycoside hydrolase family 32 protein n=1 Tax=Desertivirga brevis TaxID=2810310 RepID=UPI001A96EA23|nr:glycoside hydrolase family 32 protein [Pedobacter sp. SYSU D00873]